jgi:Zn-dependent protease with chaperone function
MPMQVACPSCGTEVRIREEHAGRRGRCLNCKAIFTAPVPEMAPVEAGFVGDAGRLADAGVAPPLQPAPAVNGDGDSAGYELADTSTKKAKAARVREERLPGVGISAKGVVEAAAPTRRTLTPQQILAAFRGEIEPVRPTILYRLWVAIVAAVMVLLPVLYVAIIGLVVAAVVYHAVNHVTIFQSVGARGSAFKFVALIYITPLIAGGTVVALMLKPLFARPARGPKQKVLDPGAEPLLYAFVDGVCGSVGSPRPARIAVDCRVNASAHREGGILGVAGGKLVLTIGLPLVAGLTLKQFSGVLAHEFGHFSQGAGMRLQTLIMRINLWFARVVYERDEWDQSIAAWSSDERGMVYVIGAIVRLAVWLTRRILWALMQLGRIVSSFLSRQMEYDADRYQARMVGGEGVAETMQRVQVMALAENGAYTDLKTSWQQRRLPDNFPKLVTANMPQIPEPMIAAYRQEMDKLGTKLFDTHPADKDRIARARREEPGPGLFHLDGPATDVFANFDALARTASLDMYKSALGPGITSEQLYEVSELVETQTAAQEGDAATGRWFLNAWNLTQRLPLSQEYPGVAGDLKSAKRDLIEARNDLVSTRSACLQANGSLDEIRNRLYMADIALVFLKTGVWFKPAVFELKAASLQAAESARDQAIAALGELDKACEPFATAASRRLTHALALLEAEPVASRVADGKARRDEARALYRCAAHLAANVAPQIARLAHARLVLSGAVQAYHAGKDQKNEPLINAMLRAAAGLHDVLEESRWKIGNAIDYPFEHADENVTLAKFAFPTLVPEKNDIGGLMNASGEALDRIAGLYRRALGRLAVTAEEVERALGLLPIRVDQPGEQQA